MSTETTEKASLLMTHDLLGSLGELRSAARRYTLPRMLSSKRRDEIDLTLTAVAFTIQLAIESGRDPAQMRLLELDLIAALQQQELLRL
jgi:hypothetical protein